MQQDSGQSSKSIYSPSVIMENVKPLPPKNHLPLRKRLKAEGSLKQQHVEKDEDEDLICQKGKENTEDYPPTPGSHSSSGSSDSTLPLIRSPPNTIVKKQPLKKSYTWISTRGKTTVLVNNNNTTHIKTLNNVGLPGNPLLWNNGNKYEPEDTIDSFKMAWLKDQEEEEEEEDEKMTKTKKPPPSKRGRPPLSKSSSLDKEIPIKRTNSSQKQQSNQEGKLYCICRQPYDATRFMIACDRCDDWFHGECIGINEKESEFIDLYFCNKCSKITKKTTSWKPKCANPACYKAARIGINLGFLSKYCSDSCGMQVARARLELAEIKRRNNTANNGPSIAHLALLKQRGLRIHSFADKEDRRRLQKIREEKRTIRHHLQIIEARNELFQKSLTTDNICGFDSRLINKEGTVCQKVDCSRHEQWQKIISLQIEQDKKEQYDLLLCLEKERKLIKERLRKRRSENDIIQDEFLINTTTTVDI